MSNETRGKALRERMVALGLDESKLSRATRKDRGTIRRAFDGTASTITYEQLELWFDREEHKSGIGVELASAASGGEDPTKHVMIRIEEGGTVVVDGPPENMDALIAAATALMREMKEKGQPNGQ